MQFYSMPPARLMPVYKTTKMGKNNKLFVYTVVLLSTLSLSAHAQAGFYDWLVNKNESTPLLISSATEDRSNISFDKIFSWDNRKPESLDSINMVEKKEEPKPELKVVKTYNVRATAYSSTPDQTDDTPCHTATNYNVCIGDKNVIAANFYVNGLRVPFGTLVRIPDVYGDKVFIVEDRMNARYTNNIDIWFPARNLALEFGIQSVTIEIVEES
ncbi:MAG: hypothetical protein Q8Q89_04075 [bacterium]|nr:hypothetical protein [bacterium]